ncbi:MAG: aldose epimerase family protein [Bacteroidales bacterium]|nr:aldose epimerase family protein [Bacteroidales bacterium]
MKKDSSTPENLSGLRGEDFQKTVNGKNTDLYFLKNGKMEIAVTNYGCAVVAMMAPDRHGDYASVVLGHDSMEHVIHSPEPFLGTTIGRYGNRIAKGKFTLNGKEYNLTINNGPNSLHGGPKGYHAVVWDVICFSESSVDFTYTSPDGEEGFPGNLMINMLYTLTKDNEFVIRYKATTDQSTPINLTNHAFFNLAGISNPSPAVTNNILTINADFFIPIDEVSIPTGEILKVEGTPMDFRTPTVVGERIDAQHKQIIFGAGYDHCYALKKSYAKELSFAAKCIEPLSGRVLEVYTTEPGIQLYTGNWLNGFSGAHGATFPKRSAICFEAQHFPDTPNQAQFPASILNPGETYTQTTVYKFGIE